MKIVITLAQAPLETLDRIRQVDASVQVAHAPYWESPAREARPDAAEADRLLEQEVREADVLLCLGLPKNILAMAPKVQWVHSHGAGVNRLEGTGIFESGLPLSNGSGANSGAMAEFCLAFMLMHTTRMPERVRNQQRHLWARATNEELSGKTLGIVGPGHIGMELVRRARALGMRVLATRRSYAPGQQLPDVERVFPLEALHQMLGECDFVVVAAALTPETRGMIGEAEFRATKPGAFFINIARGAIVKEDALLRALKDGHLGGAGLDVFDPEPLSPESELWDLPNVIVTPHNSGAVGDVSHRFLEGFCENLRRYLDGRPLQNLTDSKRGY